MHLISAGGHAPECTIDTSHVIISLNDEFRAMSGGLAGVVLKEGDPFLDYFPKSQRGSLEEIIHRAWEREISFAVIGYPFPEEERAIEVMFTVWTGEDGRNLCLHMAFRDITEIHQAEQKISSLAGRFQAVLESSVDLNTSIKEPETIYRTTMEKLAAAIEFDTGTIQLLDDNMLLVVAHHGFGQNAILDSLRFPLDDRFPNLRVIKGKRPLALADIRTDFPHFLTEQGQFESGHIRTWMGVPIIDRGEIWGMVTLDRNEVRPFDAEDIELATAIANHAGVAISNARLYADLNRSNAIQQALMQELHHRVKNNMQLVSSLINIRSAGLSDTTQEILGEIRTRILTLAAVHESLYKSPDLDVIDLSDYVERVIREIDAGYTPGASGIAIKSVLSPARIHIDVAIPLGMILSELILNAIKHAFPVGGSGMDGLPRPLVLITASVPEGASAIHVEVRDNGRGMPPETAIHDSFGMVLIRTLSEQIHATVSSGPAEEITAFGKGTIWSLLVPME